MDATSVILERSRNRQRFYEIAIKMLSVAKSKGIRLIMENPWGTQSFLQRDFVTPPAFIDKDRTQRGDYFVKPTAYWFINSSPTNGFTYQKIHMAKRVKKDCKPGKQKGVCSEERSMISSDYARNFICDFILGKAQPDICPTLFD